MPTQTMKTKYADINAATPSNPDEVKTGVFGKPTSTGNSEVLKPKVNSSHKVPGASALSPEGRSQRIAQVNADIAAKKPPAPPAPIPGLSHSGATPTPKAPMAKNPAKSFSIMDRLKTAGASFMNTIGKMGKQVQTKVQGAATMPGVNSKMTKTEVELVDLLKGQMSKLGKPQISAPPGRGLPSKYGTPDPQPAQAPAAPPHASTSAPSEPVAAPVPAKPLVPHVAAAHKTAKSRANHNKIREKVKQAKTPPEKPNPLPNPQPQDHAVKSPENHQHFQAQAKQSTLTPPRSKSIIPKTDPRNMKAVLQQQQRQFESEKTATFTPAPAQNDGWSKPQSEATEEVTQVQKQKAGVAPSYGKPASNDPEATEKVAANAKFTNENPKKASVSERVESESTPVIPRRQAAGSAKGQVNQAAGQNKASGTGSNGQPPPNQAQSGVSTQKRPVVPQLQTKNIGVQKPFQENEAHGKLLQFLHQLVAPGSQSNDPRAMVQHSKHFLHKTEAASLGSVHNRKKLLHAIRKCGKMPS